MAVYSGRYGPYVKHGKVNATIPSSSDPAKVTLEEALELLAAKEAKGGKGVKKGGRSVPRSKAPAKTAPAPRKTAKAKPKAPAKRKPAAKKKA